MFKKNKKFRKKQISSDEEENDLLYGKLTVIDSTKNKKIMKKKE